MKNKNLTYIIVGIGIAAIVVIAAVLIADRNKTAENLAHQPPIAATNVVLKTNKGDIHIELFDQHRPITAGNFISLIERDFYDGLIFHRVIDGFMIQGGCPYGTGFGGPGYTIQDEFAGHNQNLKGTISMANAGPNTGGSQFFINLADNNFLDTRHSVFGKVIQGMDIVEAIGKTQTGPGDRPVQDIVIKDIEIAEKRF
jgi:peptidylprolyl isomerase